MGRYSIDQKIIVTNLSYKTASRILYYSYKIGKIKGIKKLQNHITLYLVEFLDHNRIWFIRYELKFII